ncbi:DNA topology modulation protein FlaR [Alkalihalobacillus sp. TS-13]|uniref:DNA topology modulation protein FlaR n=1 Tax=Alkalihalobacillus sp. TS-13 TaxID=2842455 RepID=UPI001C88B725|nr:DNA topology modulation protein FlaR [Alkalihalobacillus sp. TS-13]
MKRIHIIGSVGSGKTTLAKVLSDRLQIPHYELDNVVWRRTAFGDVRRTEQERDERLGEIISTEQWILEGAHHTWIKESLQNADCIILLDTPYSKRVYRIIKRFIFQKFGLEKANYKPTFKIFRKMFVWNAAYQNQNRQEILELLSTYDEKVVILQDNKQIEKHLNR